MTTYAIGGTGQKTAASPAVALTTSPLSYTGGVTISNRDASLDVYLGVSGVDSTNGYILSPGQSISLGIIDISTIYAYSIGSPIVTWLGLTVTS